VSKKDKTLKKKYPRKKKLRKRAYITFEKDV